MDLARFALEKRLISAVATVLILFAGYFAYTALPRFEDPEFVIRQAQIITPYPGASAEEVAEEVTEVVENALQQLPGLDEVRSVSSPGLSTVTVEFTIAATPGYSELDQTFAKMRAKISDSQSQLPPNALESQVYDDFGDVYAQYYAITGEGFTITDLYEYAKDLQRELVTVDGVSKVVLNGVQEEVIYVEYSPERLTELGLAPQQIQQLLEGQNLVTPGGSIVAGMSRLSVRPESAVGSIDAIENLLITNAQTGTSFRLGDIATVSRGLKEPAGTLLFRNGEQAVGLGISNQRGGNVVNMSNAVKDRIAELESERPIGINVLPISDQGAAVKSSVDDFVVNVALALAIVVGTLLIFMGLRSGILMGGILLVTIAGTLFGMYLYGLNMQRISLGALIIALGMLVDNAIVVVEGTLVRVQRGEDAGKASRAVVKQTMWPLLGGTVVGILAFSPIGFSPDNTGEYASSLFWTIGIALLFSWLVAIWLTPYYCTVMLKQGKDGNTDKENFILTGYRKFLNIAIKAKWITVGVTVALFVSAIAMFSAVPAGFFPSSTRDQFVIDYFLPQGADISRTNADLTEIAEYARGLEGVTGTNTVVGGGHLRFMLIYEAEGGNAAYGQVLVDVEDFNVIDGLRTDLQAYIDETYPEANSKVWKFVLGPGGGSKIEARFFGSDPAVLRDLAGQAKTIMSDAGAVAVKDDWREQVQVVRPVIDIENARRLGLAQGEISNAIYSHLTGTNLGVYRERDELRNVIMRPVEDARNDINQLRDIQVYSAAIGGYIPISQVVDRFDIVFEAGNLRRIDRALAITAQSDNAPGVLSGDLFAAVKGPIEDIALPPGYSMEWEGEYGSSQEANAGLASTMPIGFGAMFIVVLFLFNAWRQTIIIWLAVPLALIGVIYGLAGTQTPLEFMAILGILSLTGMLIKNAIVLIDETDTQIGDGKARMSAVVDSAVSRVRPVSLGVLTTVLGVVPLLWDPFFKSLAVVIICGLSFATVLTLIVVPALYAIFFRVKQNEIAAE
ncbi:efflux RND transporter permease subunit [Sulfitobacter mediterraneus]|uniref:efflux RND transporter permease subunit n=1 Tax=Sulfitobacter mediterraneus TaxID=83219 RepID=UPI0019349269|nr:efflux RND transporter permease subunit [Sulfitobacter mediterraneus]MBM1308713.1 efflux RND transporter permease subunit [Sulfitobacter mediterraneus]MBM1312598.1 efflux RND transporter permease subunit [Sulfitobacter mediterraneus]MBM1320979.1 efflux RND transporter permease subunit [Sulfitobacter mediterraneus]MBM1324867.1 efflux RND transporter permease subunit [Sulfitobacter mediterraneus]MBM1396213.1 efflux RND transporter permease subunit [Sulfitobacter mediterraneus]